MGRVGGVGERRLADARGQRMPGATQRWNRGKDLSWEPLRIERVCEVAYDHLQGDRFRHGTTFRRWRPDKAPDDLPLRPARDRRPRSSWLRIFATRRGMTAVHSDPPLGGRLRCPIRCDRMTRRPSTRPAPKAGRRAPKIRAVSAGSGDPSTPAWEATCIGRCAGGARGTGACGTGRARPGTSLPATQSSRRRRPGTSRRPGRAGTAPPPTYQQPTYQQPAYEAPPVALPPPVAQPTDVASVTRPISPPTSRRPTRRLRARQPTYQQPRLPATAVPAARSTSTGLPAAAVRSSRRVPAQLAVSAGLPAAVRAAGRTPRPQHATAAASWYPRRSYGCS